MKFANWFKIGWWLLLIAVLTAYLYVRYSELKAGMAVPADIVVFVIWIALLLAPLFKEVSLLGITLKQDIKELKDFVSAQVNEVRSEVRNAVDIRTTFSQQFNIPAPPSDAQLPELETRIKAAVSEALDAHGLQAVQPGSSLTAPDEVAILFAARYNIERELRRIVEGRQTSISISRPTMPQMTRFLVEAELLEPRLINAIREVYSVCSPAIHGQQVTHAQVAFVKDVAPELIAALRAIS